MDEVDREIIRRLLLNGPMTISEIAKEMFDLKDVHDLRKESSFLRYRLTALIDLGVLAHDRKSKRYDIISDCEIGQSIVQLFGVNDQGEVEMKDSITNGLTVFVYTDDGTLILFLDQPKDVQNTCNSFASAEPVHSE